MDHRIQDRQTDDGRTDKTDWIDRQMDRSIYTPIYFLALVTGRAWEHLDFSTKRNQGFLENS